MKKSRYPSRLPFGCFFQYVPKSRAESDADRQSWVFTYAVQDDTLVRRSGKNVRAIELAANTILKRKADHEFLEAYFDENVTLVPMPGHAPLVKDALWTPRLLCEAFVENGLGVQAMNCLERTKPVTRSSRAGAGQRPDPPQHFESLAVKKELLVTKEITLVDDVITRGSTMVGAAARIKQDWPEVTVRCFALVRTRNASEGVITEPAEIISPIEGVIKYQEGGWPQRDDVTEFD